MKSKYLMIVIIACAAGRSVKAVAESQQGWRAGLSFVNDGVLATEGALESPEMGKVFRFGLAVAERSFAIPGIDPRQVNLIDPQVRASYDGVIGSHGTGSTQVTQRLVSAFSMGASQARFSEGESIKTFSFTSIRIGIHFELGKTLLGSGVSLRHAWLSKKQEAAFDSYGIHYERASLSPYLTIGVSL